MTYSMEWKKEIIKKQKFWKKCTYIHIFKIQTHIHIKEINKIIYFKSLKVKKKDEAKKYKGNKIKCKRRKHQRNISRNHPTNELNTFHMENSLKVPNTTQMEIYPSQGILSKNFRTLWNEYTS